MLVVEGTAVMRRILTEGLATDPAIEVIGTASNGRIALGKIERLKPDLITLDLELPEMARLELLREIQRAQPRLRILALSPFVRSGTPPGLDALTRSVVGWATKPEDPGNREPATRWVVEEIGARVRTLCASLFDGPLRAPPARRGGAPPGAHASSPRPGGGEASQDSERPRRRIEVLVIGASTGGPNALAALLPQLGGDLPVPVLIVQHMPPVFTRFLADRLGKRSRLRVAEAVDGIVVRAGDVWIAPGDRHITVERRGAEVLLAVNQDPPENSCRPSADVLFRSAARAYGAGTLAVVLTGMGRDGMLGCDAIRAQGGQVIVQDSATSVVWGMPGAVANAGLAEQVLPLDEIASAAERTVWAGRRGRRGTGEAGAA